MRTVLAKEFEGCIYKFLVDDTYIASFEPVRDYESSIIKILCRLGKYMDIFVDVGACVGKYCIYLAKFYKKVYAIEPNPVNLEYLKTNIELNNLTNVEVLNYGVLDSETEMFVTLEGTYSKVVPKAGVNTVKVKVSRLDKLVPQADVIKIDTEGNEFKIVLGASELIIRNRPIFVIEHDEFWFHKPLKDFKEIVKFMLNLKYLPFNINQVHWIYIPVEKFDSIPFDIASEIVGKHFFYEVILNNLKNNLPWYYGFPESWWHGMSILEFVNFVAKYIFEIRESKKIWKEEWKRVYDESVFKYIQQ